ncbi:NAD-dependent epimerase/dehydratase family protein [Streptomyces sp. YGL11-2]|uniref:NAD-dependent epimerase/dehydratase family protein n=1 Tax=Streptomyces sp. YGL11-2 TaxID=3414028 RepID=UPI003CF37D0B
MVLDCADLLQPSSNSRTRGELSLVEIFGRGFIARNLTTLADAHPGVVALAAGVSHVSLLSPRAAFAREADLVRRVAEDCARRDRTMVLFSTASAAVYGRPGCAGDESCDHPPTTPYGTHKLAMERLVARSGCRWLVLRLSHLVGADQPPHQLVPELTRRVLAGRVRIFRGARRDVLDVVDFVQIVDALLTAGVRGEIVNVASGRSVDVATIVRHIAGVLGAEPSYEYIQRSSDHQVSTEKLRRLVPSFAEAPDDYFAAVLNRYVPTIARRHAQNCFKVFD